MWEEAKEYYGTMYYFYVANLDEDNETTKILWNRFEKDYGFNGAPALVWVDSKGKAVKGNSVFDETGTNPDSMQYQFQHILQNGLVGWGGFENALAILVAQAKGKPILMYLSSTT